MLNFNIRGENIEVTPAIRDHVESKIEKVERFFNGDINANANVNLKINNGKAKVEVTTANSDEEARELLTQFGMPFQK